MEHKFNASEYKAAYDKVKLSKQQKNAIIMKALNAEQSSNKKPNAMNFILSFSYKRVTACVLVVALLLGSIIFIASSKPKNSFIITSSAAELPESEQNGAVIGAFSNSAHSGFLMRDFEHNDENNPLYSGTCLNAQGKIDYFDVFELTELYVVGKNIESVTFKANKKFTYFSFNLLGHNDKTEGEIFDMFTDYESIDNSQYTKSEGSGFFAAKGRCDSFTYINPNISSDEQTLNLSGYFDFVIESDRTDDEIDKCVDKIEKNYSALEKVVTSDGISYRNNSGKTEEELTKELSEQVGLIDKKTLEYADIDVTVHFADGSTQTNVIDVDYYQSFENDEYGYSQIILRYKA